MPLLDPPDWTPEISDVALRLIARTRQPNGVLAKTFNSQTQPTDVDVTGIIAQAVQILRPRLGPVPDSLSDMAKQLAVSKAACMIEQSYFMEQIATGASPYRDLQGEHLHGLEAWDEAARGEQPNGLKCAALRVSTLYPSYATGTF